MRFIEGYGEKEVNCEIGHVWIDMFRVLPPASPPPFVVSRFGGEELLPGTLDTMRGS